MTDFEPWITEPGVYNLTADQYHADPVVGGSLSNTGAKKLLPPNCPAIYKHWRDSDDDERSDSLDFGRAAHTRLLGVGDEVVVVDAPDWRGKDAAAARKAAAAEGKTAILSKQDETIDAMVEALRAHPMASTLLAPGSGEPEQTLVWRDAESGVMCRALVDHLRHPRLGRRLVLVDYKTAKAVDPESISKALWEFKYFGQGAWYSDGAEALGLSAGPPAFVLIFQMKTAPYLVTCVQLHHEDVLWGHARNRKARDIYRHCTERDQWPGYADDHVLTDVHLPPYALNQLDAAQQLGLFEPEGATL